MATGIGQAATTVIRLASTVILARLLTRADYGLVAMVAAITALAQVFRDLGLSSAAIQSKTLTDRQQSNLFWLNVLMGTALTALVMACAPVIAWFYQRDELTAIAAALSLGFLINSVGTQFDAWLVRQMRFGRRAAAQVIGEITSLVVTVVLALAGFSYWALVAGALMRNATTTVLLIALSPFRIYWWQRDAGTRKFLNFGYHVTLFNIVNYLHRNLDNIVVGRFAGADSLGIYTRAYALIIFPISAIRGPLAAVAFPAMSRLKDNHHAYKSYYCQIVRIVATASMPVVGLLWAGSDVVVDVLLGKQWLAASPVFSVLALVAFIQPAASLRGVVMLSRGDGPRYSTWGLVNAVCVSLGFVIGIRWGIVGVAWSYVIVSYALLYPSLWFAFQNAPIRPRDFFVSVFKPACASILTAAVIHVFLLEFGWPDGQSLKLVVATLLALVVFVLTYSALPRGLSELRDTVMLAQLALQSGSSRGGSRTS